jgi:hypothetical protein
MWPTVRYVNYLLKWPKQLGSGITVTGIRIILSKLFRYDFPRETENELETLNPPLWSTSTHVVLQSTFSRWCMIFKQTTSDMLWFILQHCQHVSPHNIYRRTTCKRWMGKDLETTGPCIKRGNILVFYRRGWEKLRKFLRQSVVLTIYELRISRTYYKRYF